MLIVCRRYLDNKNITNNFHRLPTDAHSGLTYENYWKRSEIVEAISNQKTLIQFCCNFFYQLFVQSNSSLATLYISEDFFKRLQLIDDDLSKYFPSNTHNLLKVLSETDILNIELIPDSIISFVNNKLLNISLQECNLPFIISLLSIYPRWLRVLKHNSSLSYILMKTKVTSM